MKKTVFKRMWLSFVLTLIIVIGAVAATGCADGKTERKVTFYDGDKVITTKTVDDGATIAKFEPKDVDYAKTDFKFISWHSTADYSFGFDFDTKIQKDVNVYSKWQSSVQDDRRWSISGESSAGGPLKEIGWNSGVYNENDITNLLTKSATENSFSITINLYAGDQFQFSVQHDDGKWVEEGGASVARGGKYLVASDNMASGTGALGEGQNNVVVGKSGNYTLTLITDAKDKAFGSITAVRNGDAPAITVDRSAYKWGLYGTSAATDSILAGMNWGAGLSNISKYSMLKVSDNADNGTGTWQITGKFAADDEFLFSVLTIGDTGVTAETGTLFKFADVKTFNGNEAKIESSGGMGGNIKIKVAGVYTFKLVVTIDAATTALVGSIEIIDNATFLKAEQNWTLLANRLSKVQLKDLLEIELTDAEYAAYVSDTTGNNFGKGTNVAKLTKVATPAAGTLSYTMTLTLGVGDYFYFCVPIKVDEIGKESWYITGGYNSTVTPARVSGTLPSGIGEVWINNFVCKTAGNYTFTVTIAADAALSVAVIAN